MENKNIKIQNVNILIAGSGSSIDMLQKSKYLNKLYITSEEKFPGVLNIKFNTFRELAAKCKALQIDLVIVEEEKWIQQGIVDVLRQNLINCLGATAKWTELGLYNSVPRKLLPKYNINIPKKIILPVDFPILVKADGITRKANSVQEIIQIRKEIFNQSSEIGNTIYLEKYIEGKTYVVTSLFDTKHLITFPNAEIPAELLDNYSKNLERMLIGENANFTGFINSKLVLSNNKLYNTGFSFNFLKPECNIDFLYLLNLTIYQKLNEIPFE